MRAVDLFCGTGGFSRGAHAAGFEVAAAFDCDPVLTSSFRFNFPQTKLVLADLAGTTGEAVSAAAGGDVDLIFGGPPCQGFSSIGHRRKDDPRRTLLGHFFRLVGEVRPRSFVMENVQGLAYAEALPELQTALSAIPASYDILGPTVLDAAAFGAATARKRIFVIGYDRARCGPISAADLDERKSPAATVAQAFSGLADARKVAGSGAFDIWQMRLDAPLSSYAELLADHDRRFTGNQRT
ncbi:MAG TPA: DNA cytosine methyltransferase, partial [Allosphingosinicella sp.]